MLVALWGSNKACIAKWEHIMLWFAVYLVLNFLCRRVLKYSILTRKVNNVKLDQNVGNLKFR